jgi:hypothetical protein
VYCRLVAFTAGEIRWSALANATAKRMLAPMALQEGKIKWKDLSSEDRRIPGLASKALRDGHIAWDDLSADERRIPGLAAGALDAQVIKWDTLSPQEKLIPGVITIGIDGPDAHIGEF